MQPSPRRFLVRPTAAEQGFLPIVRSALGLSKARGARAGVDRASRPDFRPTEHARDPGNAIDPSPRKLAPARTHRPARIAAGAPANATSTRASCGSERLARRMLRKPACAALHALRQTAAPVLQRRLASGRPASAAQRSAMKCSANERAGVRFRGRPDGLCDLPRQAVAAVGGGRRRRPARCIVGLRLRRRSVGRLLYIVRRWRAGGLGSSLAVAAAAPCVVASMCACLYVREPACVRVASRCCCACHCIVCVRGRGAGTSCIGRLWA
jgi:hypothetical protein